MSLAASHRFDELDRAADLRALPDGPRVVHIAKAERSVFVREDVAPIRRHDPGHPLADENGDVWEAPVDENAEMVEMLEASRQYSNMVEALSTAKQLMLETMRMK